jgi:hypothetical protein
MTALHALEELAGDGLDHEPLDVTSPAEGRDARSQAIVAPLLARALARASAASGLSVDVIRDPMRAITVPLRRRAKLARYIVYTWLRREHRLTAKAIAEALDVNAAALMSSFRTAERDLQEIVWAGSVLDAFEEKRSCSSGA